MTHITNYGFIKLTGGENGLPLYVKARDIKVIGKHDKEGSWIWATVDTFWVKQTVAEITELLDAVHPDLL